MRTHLILSCTLAALYCGATGAVQAADSTDTATDTDDMAILEIERLFAAPDLDGPSPRGVKISPDSSRVTFLRGKETDPLQMDLWEYNLADREMRLLVDSTALVAGDEALSEEELARRERLRIVGQRGIVSYQFAPDGNRLLFPLNGDLFLYDLDGHETRQLTDTEAGETDPKFSATGRYVSFIRDQDLFAVDLDTFDELRLTHDGGGLIRNGMAEFIAQEEMDRYTGYWWAPDDSAVAFVRVDESPVHVAERFEIYAENFKVYEQRYPATGTPNVLVRLGVVAPDGTDLRWMDIGKETDIYLPRVDWFPGSQFLAVQRQSRDQQTLELLKIHARSGEARVLLTETSDTWINLHNELRFLESRPQFIWGSERSGHAHLYLYDNDGRLLRQLTSGDWDVVDGARARSALLHIDGEGDRLFVTGTLASPMERNIYEVSLSGNGEPRRISKDAGWHQADFADSGEFYVDSFNSTGTPPQLSLHRADGSRIDFIEENRLDETHPYHPYVANRPLTEFGTLRAEDGQPLYYRMLKPAGFDADKRYPVIVFVYGGPMGQSVTNTWAAGFNEILAREGFIVFTIDNRGTGFRGTAFDAPIFRRGRCQLPEVAGLRRPGEDRRVGLELWRLHDANEPVQAARCVCRRRIRSTRYRLDAVRHALHRALPRHAARQPGRLRGVGRLSLRVADDNVLFTNSTKLMKALQDDGRPFDVMTYPGSKHGLMRVPATGQHVFAHILRFFRQHLE
jgi:dipeptidyl-peptidase-4